MQTPYLGHSVDGHPHLVGGVPEDGEDDDAGDEAGQKVHHGDNVGVDVNLERRSLGMRVK